MIRLIPILLVVLASSARAADRIEYHVRLREPQTQTVDVTVEVPAVTATTMRFQLPTWRPGKYMIMDPAGTVRYLHAFDAHGDPLPITKTDKSTWEVQTNGAAHVRVQYRLYANSIRDRTRHVDDTHAFLSGSSVFPYVPERRGEPIRVIVEAPLHWSVATGLEPDPHVPSAWLAPNYDVLVDAPLEIGEHDRLRFEVDGVPHEIAIWPPKVDYDAEQLTEDFRRIVATQVPIFGDIPYERYVFLLHVGLPRGGTEHLNSTIMQAPRHELEGSFAQDRAYQGFLGLVAHEFFHTWNVKQLRPAGIHPYDYQRENYTPNLWVAEGTTSYYDDLTLLRSGIIESDRYLEILGGAITRLRERPGAAVQSLEESSFDAWIKHSRPSPDSINSTVSFYSKGALVSLALDAEIRRRSGGAASLDDVLREMYRRFPLSGPGYTARDVQEAAEARAGTSLESFFSRYVRGTHELPLDELVGVFGLDLARERPDESEERAGDTRAYLGLRLRERDGRTFVRYVLADGPAYAAGVIADDEIIALDDRRLPAKDLERRLERRLPGDRVTLHVMRRDVLRVLEITLGERADGGWKLTRVEEPTEVQRAAWASWTGLAWDEEEDEEEEETRE